MNRPKKLPQTPPAALQATPQYVLGRRTAALAPPRDWGPARGGRSGAWSRSPRLTPTCGRACGGAAPPGLWKHARGRVIARRRWREGSELLVVFRDSSDFAARFFLNLVALDVGVAEGEWEGVAERSEGRRQELL